MFDKKEYNRRQRLLRKSRACQMCLKRVAKTVIERLQIDDRGLFVKKQIRYCGKC